jgi:hypothetical protein
VIAELYGANPSAAIWKDEREVAYRMPSTKAFVVMLGTSFVCLDWNECVSVAKVLIVLGPHTLSLLADESPPLIAFHVPNLNVADFLGHDAFSHLSPARG